MAKFYAQDYKITVGTTNLSSSINSVTLDITADEIEVIGESCQEHGAWGYHTIIALAHERCDPIAANQESIEVRWVERSEVSTLALHPAFSKNWSMLLELIHTLP